MRDSFAICSGVRFGSSMNPDKINLRISPSDFWNLIGRRQILIGMLKARQMASHRALAGGFAGAGPVCVEPSREGLAWAQRWQRGKKTFCVSAPAGFF